VIPALALRTRMTFAVPRLPMSLNDWTRRHWSVRDRETKAWREWVQCTCHWLGAPLDGAVRVTLSFRQTRRHRMDLDGYAPKMALDALQGVAYTNDRQVRELVMRLEDERGEPRTTITVEEI